MLTRRAFVEGLGVAAGGDGDDPWGHALALAEARRLQARARVLLAGQGAPGLDALFADPRWLYPDNDAGRDQAVADMNASLAAIRPRLAAVFDLPLPPVVIRRQTPSEIAAGQGGTRTPEGYTVDLRDIRARPAWTLPTVAFHETVPGHRLLPSGARTDPEAWATYAEQLAHDLGAYAHDPRAELGYLHWRLFRMARIVADTGMARLGWSPARAATEMRAIQGTDIAFVTLGADVARMAKTPGVYAAQGLKALEIGRRRPPARRDWPAYHRVVLSG